MATTAPYPGRHGQDHFHPAVYQAMAAFAVMMIVASVAFFADGGPDSYVYVVVAGFILGSLGLPYVARRMRRLDQRPWRGSVPPAMTGESLRDCAKGEFSAGQSRIGGREAMIQALLPIAAVGIGMVLLAAAMVIATAGAPG